MTTTYQRRDMMKDFRRVTVVTDSDTRHWIRNEARLAGLSQANFLDQIIQIERAKSGK